MPPAGTWLALLSLAAVQLACGAPVGAAGAPEMHADAPGPAPATAGSCPFTLRVAGQLIPVAQAPEEARYIVACHSMEQRGQLAELVAAARRNGTAGAAPPLAPLTQTMPLLVGNLSRADLLWLCHDVRASACVDYIERDEQVSIV
ncbi:hypothetical protein ABPG77_007561 [Micractinium sp. CCAP 211/92]